MNTINTRLAVIDALAWPLVIFAFIMVKSDYQVSEVHGLAVVVLGIWALRKLGWALDGYREPSGDRWIAFNPFNPVSVILAAVCFFLARKEGAYSYTTTTVLVWSLGFLAVGLLIKLFA